MFFMQKRSNKWGAIGIGAMLLGVFAVMTVGNLSVAQATDRILSFQQGQNGYAGTQDVLISTQYAEWTDGKGVTRTDGVSKVAIRSGEKGYEERTLLQFKDLSSASGVTVGRAVLRLTFTNWEGSPVVRGFYLKTPWNGKSADISWRYRNDGVEWGAPGAVSPQETWANKSFTVLDLTKHGEQVREIELDPEVVQAWIEDPAKNNGMVLITETLGAIIDVHGSEDGSVEKRPRLVIYPKGVSAPVTNPAPNPAPAPQPKPTPVPAPEEPVVSPEPTPVPAPEPTPVPAPVSVVISEGTIIANHTTTDISNIPESVIRDISNRFRIYYGHTSHGSQIVSGMEAMHDGPGTLFYVDDQESTGGLLLVDGYGDLGNNGSLAWERQTREVLNDPNRKFNIVVWSWCGGAGDNTEAGIRTYLDAMNRLERDYPNIVFIYMTGHLDGTGTSGTLNRNNEQIRRYVRENGKILFDFADIESYDPDGNEFLSRGADDGASYNGGNWAREWCSRNPGSPLCASLSYCAHTEDLNCNLKARAFWWLLARIAGWNPDGSVTPVPTPQPVPVPAPTEPSAENRMPEVMMITPKNGSTIEGPRDIRLEALASDSDGAVVRVDFYRGTTKIGEDATAPYEFIWKNVGPLTYDLSAVAVDNEGGMTGSLTTRIYVVKAQEPDPIPQPEPTPVPVPSPTPAPASSPIFYVATNGSDQGDGSIDHPWGSLTYAINTIPEGATVLVRPGTYSGVQLGRGDVARLDRCFQTETIVKSEVPYQARLRGTSGSVVRVFYGCNITMEGFDVAHDGSSDQPLLKQIQDANWDGTVHGITIKNNILHDSYNNDIIKLNNGAREVSIIGNMFYNQGASDEHIDINSARDVLVEGNVFFNDFAGSGRVNNHESSAYIVVKDSNDDDDAYLGTKNVTIRRNVFLNWEGSYGYGFLQMGEDGYDFYEAQNVTVENNLFLGNGTDIMRSPFGVMGCADITYRNNTIVGDAPASAYAMRMYRVWINQPNRNIRFFNNIWSDPTGTMGAGQNAENDFSDTPAGDTESFTLMGNLYWNGGRSIPESAEDTVNWTDDITARVEDPKLPGQAGMVIPRWNAAQSRFADGSQTIWEAFVRLVETYGKPAGDSPVIDASNPTHAPLDDILGRPRTNPDLGAYEVR